MTDDETRIADLFVFAVAHLEELADRELTPAGINGILALTNRVRGMSQHGSDRYELALQRSAQATLALHTHQDDEAARTEWINARDELLSIWNG